MAIGSINHDASQMRSILPGLSQIEQCVWVMHDDCDDGIPGLVSTWVDAVVRVTPALAEHLHQYAPDEVDHHPPIVNDLGVVEALAWFSGPRLWEALGATDWDVDAAISDCWVVLRAARGG